MLRRVIVGLGAGAVFLVLDGVINANPLAQRLYGAYAPLARSSVNALAGSALDLVYGVVLAWLFVRLRPSLPGRSSLSKGAAFGLMVWFLRVAMRVAGEWVVTTVPLTAHAYTLAAGLVQLLLVAILIGVLLPEGSEPGTARGSA
jgi:hypothetical protein